MATQYYNQPQISINDQIQLLKSEGLIINDEGKAAQWKFSGDKHKSLQVYTERTFHQRYLLVML